MERRFANTDRADAAAEALGVFCRKTYHKSLEELMSPPPELMGPEDRETGDARSAICDLMADLYHLAKRHGLDVEKLSRDAIGSFEEEVALEEIGHDEL